MSKQVARGTGPVADPSSTPPVRGPPVTLTRQAEPVVSLPVISNLLLYSCGMVVVPTVLFMSTVYGYLDPLFKLALGPLTEQTRNTIGGILSVIGVNVVVGLFIFTAFKDEEEPTSSKRAATAAASATAVASSSSAGVKSKDE